MKKTFSETYGKPRLLKDGHTVLYGVYPYSVVWSKDVIYHIKKEGVYDFKYQTYRYKNGLYIKGKTFKFISKISDAEENRFRNGRIVKPDKEYWFKCKEISWKVLSKKENIYTLITEHIIDGGIKYSSILPDCFKAYSHSFIREWLNKDFFDFAFQFGSENIITAIVNNGPETSSIVNNHSISEDTKDKVFLLCFKDFFKKRYGFADVKKSFEWHFLYEKVCYSSDTFSSQATDFAIYRKGTWHNDYWTRSPGDNDSSIWYIKDSVLSLICCEGVSSRLVGGSRRSSKGRRWSLGISPGVRPVIMVKIN